MMQLSTQDIAAAIERVVLAKGKKTQGRQGTGRFTHGMFFLKGVEYRLDQLIHKEYEAHKDGKTCTARQGGSVLFEWNWIPGSPETKTYSHGPWVFELLAAAAELDVELAVVTEAWPSPLTVDAFSVLRGGVVNRSSGPARKVTLAFSGECAIEPQRLNVAQELEPGETVAWQVRIAPRASGQVPLRWDLTFEDALGAVRKELGELMAPVERPSPATPSTNVFQGPVTVQGDFLQPGAIKQGEGVIVQKPNSSPPGTRD